LNPKDLAIPLSTVMYTRSPRFVAVALFIVVAPVLAGCGASHIPGTNVPDTRENREVLEVAERYRHAVERRDAQTLLSLASPRYFEDGGTPQGDDDYGYEGLRRLLSVWTEEVREVRYEMRYRRISFENNGHRALVEYTYTGSYTLRRPQVQMPEGVEPPAASMISVDPVRGATPVNDEQEVWFRRVADNRLELERDRDGWRIVAGM
jgi:hypothetical protein